MRLAGPAIVVLTLALLGAEASAKVVCPPGRFIVHAVNAADEPLVGGLAIDLGDGQAALAGMCPPRAAGQFLPRMHRWLLQVRVRWAGCTRPRRAAFRARFDLEAPYCTRLAGTLRLGKRQIAVIADREPACGNDLREPGEQCDGQDDIASGACCTSDCTVKPGCAVRCDVDRFPCDPAEICMTPCGFSGTCQPREAVDCGTGPVCGCDLVTTYADRCAAFDAGTGVRAPGACVPPQASGTER